MPLVITAKKTGIVIVLVTIAVIIYDIFAAYSSAPDATISQVLLKAALHTPAIAFGSGFLCGHLFWPQSKPADSGQ